MQDDTTANTLTANHTFGAFVTASMKDAFDFVAGMRKQIGSVADLLANNTNKAVMRRPGKGTYSCRHCVTILLKDKEYKNSCVKKSRE